jgi:hypothetical protein
MDWNTFRKSLFVTVCCGWLAGVAVAQDPPGGAMPEAIMQKWIEFMTPGSAHTQLDQRVGNWKVKLETWTAPDTQPTVSDATAKMEWAMGRRYIVETIKGNYSNLPFEGMGFTGYDNLKKKFVTVWIDNMGTGMMTGSGSYDDAAKTYVFTVLAPDVVTGDYKPGRLVQRMASANELVIEMFDTTPEGKEFVALKAVYARVK